MNATGITPADLDRLIARAQHMGIETAIVETHKLLTLLGHDDAADALLRHHDSIVARAESHWQTECVIAKAMKFA